MFCSHCGNPNPENAAYCTKCGSPLKGQQKGEAAQVPDQASLEAQVQAFPPPDQSTAYPTQVPYPQPYPAYGYPQYPPGKKKKTGLIIGIITAALLIAALALTLILLLGKGKDKSRNRKEGSSQIQSTTGTTVLHRGDRQDTNISGNWVVVDREGQSDYDPGMVLIFKADGTLKLEASKDAPDYVKKIIEFESVAKMNYKVNEGQLTISKDFMGLMEESVMRYV